MSILGLIYKKLIVSIKRLSNSLQSGLSKFLSVFEMGLQDDPFFLSALQYQILIVMLSFSLTKQGLISLQIFT